MAPRPEGVMNWVPSGRVKNKPLISLIFLCCIVVERNAYLEAILPAINRLKLNYWHHEGINLHSRDIRKAKGPLLLRLGKK